MNIQKFTTIHAQFLNKLDIGFNTGPNIQHTPIQARTMLKYTDKISSFTVTLTYHAYSPKGCTVEPDTMPLGQSDLIQTQPMAKVSENWT